MTAPDPILAAAATRSTQLWRLRITIFCQMTALGILFPFEGIWMKLNHLGEGTIGLLGGVTTLLGFATGLFWAHIADRTQRPHRIAIAGYICLAATTFYLAHCSTLPQCIIYSVARGLVMAMALNMIPLMAVSIIDTATAGRGYASYRVFGSIGFIAGTLIGPAIFTEVRQLIFVAAAVLITGAIPLLRFGSEITEHQPFASPWKVLHNRALIGLFLAMLFFAFASPAVFRFTPIYASQLGADTRFIGIFSSINGFVALIALPIAGFVIDRWGTRLMIWLALAAQPLRLLGYSMVTTDYHWLIPSQAFHFFTWAGLEVAGILFVTRNAKPGNRATAIALLLGSQTIGMLAGGIICGHLAEAYSYPTMFRVTAIVAALALVVFAIAEKISRATNTPEDDAPGPIAATPVTDRAP